MTVHIIDDTQSELRDFRFFSRLAFASIAIVFGGFGAWSALAPLDSAAVASGRVSVEGDRKPIQHLEGGIIREILVRDAQIVEEGDVLFRLQPTQAQSTTETLKKQIDASMAMEARLMAESELAAIAACETIFEQCSLATPASRPTTRTWTCSAMR
ncbi:MAG: hypothetical protein SH859_08385 [Hyphomicrobium aestuarii]|nr:hypothetical protein [Hyphomicrobium aestuarii]